MNKSNESNSHASAFGVVVVTSDNTGAVRKVSLNVGGRLLLGLYGSLGTGEAALAMVMARAKRIGLLCAITSCEQYKSQAPTAING